ncbi:MAG: prolyl oligopeptidase family serine peptidase [Nanoarchaeota archaeon]|nr:prolyl oligopeptidase family serine peptidase [Nanoarchaeota archaeon]
MKKIELKSFDDLNIYGHISFPKNYKNKKNPAILFISGGIHGSAYDKGGKEYDPLHVSISDYFNKKGYIALILDKRGSKGYGIKYLSYLDCCGKEVKDIIAGGNYLQNLRYVNKNKIIIHGTSRSATLAALVLSKTDIFSAGVLASGFYDLYKQYKYEEKYRKEIFPTKQALNNKEIEEVPYKQRSPINFVKNINCPLLIVHGTDDPITPLDFSLEFYKKLKKYGKDVLFIKYKRFAHLKIYSYPEHPSGKEYWKDVINFLKEKLNI